MLLSALVVVISYGSSRSLKHHVWKGERRTLQAKGTFAQEGKVGGGVRALGEILPSGETADR